MSAKQTSSGKDSTREKPKPAKPLTPEQVKEIRTVQRYSYAIQTDKGLQKRTRRGLARDLAALYGVSIHTIRHVFKRERHRNKRKPK